MGSWASIKVTYFAWEATWERILTMYLLRRRGDGFWQFIIVCAKMQKK